MDTDLDKMLKRIQALIAKADGTDYPEEAATFRAKAEALMHQYRIEESMLASAAPAGSIVPVWQTWPVCRTDSEFRNHYTQIAAYILHHIGGRCVFTVTSKDDGLWDVMICVGYESDLRYGEMLFTSAMLAFGNLLEPKHDPTLSDQVNAYRMRKAGMEGWKIAYVLWGYKLGLDPNPNSVGRNAGKARRLYRAQAVVLGEDPKELMGQGNNVETYRRSYAEGFVSEIWNRLLRMRYTKGEESQGLVLAGRKEAVAEAFYERYPQYRPQASAKPIGNGRDGCVRCAKAKSGYCRDHAHLKPSNGRTHERPVNYRAARRGADAAATVDLGTKGRLT